MEVFHKYVPTRAGTGTLMLPNDNSLDFYDTNFHEILLGDDQLTVARCCGAAAQRWNHNEPSDCLEGLIPVIVDWHARQTLLRVTYCLYSKLLV